MIFSFFFTEEFFPQSTSTELLDVMLGSLRADDNTWRVLLVDKQSMKIISACCRLFNVMEKGVAGILRFLL